ncbi:MAG: TIGR03905 family protein [Rhodobacteraceae bacterium GWF1_65_7]|nr:MAG: TIGR03905 family protein [Rhodobacteraceae bacterium GWF1_65_7]
MFEFFPTATCAKKIMFSIEDNKLRNLHFFRGCDGNLKTLSKLLDGTDVDEVVEKLRGIQCGTRGTSCSDQLALAIIAAMESRREPIGGAACESGHKVVDGVHGGQKGIADL